MRIRGDDNGYTLWLSAHDTSEWANRAGFRGWVNRFRGVRVKVTVDSNGISEVTINGREGDVPNDELEAIVGDHLPAQFRRLWPIWETK